MGKGGSRGVICGGGVVCGRDGGGGGDDAGGGNSGVQRVTCSRGCGYDGSSFAATFPNILR